MRNKIYLKEVLDLISYEEFIGNGNGYINKVIPLNESKRDQSSLSWCNEKNINQLKELKKGTFIIPSSVEKKELSKSCNYILTKNPRAIFQKVLVSFFSKNRVPQGITIGRGAIINSDIKGIKNISIGSNCVIEENCSIEENVTIGSNTVIKEGTKIGNNVIIGCNCTIGGVGFGYEKDDNGTYVFIPHLGNVTIEENVEIGNNTCIDRAVLGSTLIRKHVKIDNLVHIAHGVHIGSNSLIIANSMIAGSCKIEENVWVAPSSSVLNGKKVEKNAIIGLGAVVIRDVEMNQIVVGNPAKPLKK